MTSRRNPQDRLVEPLYEMQDVPPAKRDLQGSQVIKVESRELWMRMLPELLLLCNEASARFEAKCKAKADEIREKTTSEGTVPDIPYSLTPIHTGKALSLEYICDRIDLDDPLDGYVIRTDPDGWMQGFITISTFTSWQRWFRWDSLVDEAGVLAYDTEGRGLDALHSMGLHTEVLGNETNKEVQWWMDRVVDADGALSAALNAEIRDGDPDGEGVIWPHVAELSLLGGIGCGSFLVELILEELEHPDSPYNYVVLQATENSVPFYEKHGFVRVGAVARYVEKNASAKPSSPMISSPASNGGQKQNGAVPVTELPSPNNDVHLLVSRSKKTNLEKSVALQPPAPKPASLFQQHAPTSYVASLESLAATFGPSLATMKMEKRQEQERKQITPPGAPPVSGASSKFEWYVVDSLETPTLAAVAGRFGVLEEDVKFLNRRQYSEEELGGKLKKGMALRIPVFPAFFDPIKHSLKFQTREPILAQDTKPMVTSAAQPGNRSPNGLWYCAKDNETARMIAAKVGCTTTDLITENSKLYPDLTPGSALMENTLLRLPSVSPKPLHDSYDNSLIEKLKAARQCWGWGGPENDKAKLSNVMTYRHWAFSDDPVEMSVSSYMMVRPLRKKPRSQVQQTKKKGSRGAKSSVTATSKVLALAKKRQAQSVDFFPVPFLYGGDPMKMLEDQAASINPAKSKSDREAVADAFSKSPRNIAEPVVQPKVEVTVKLRCKSLKAQTKKRHPALRMGPLIARAEIVCEDDPRQGKRMRNTATSLPVSGEARAKTRVIASPNDPNAKLQVHILGAPFVGHVRTAYLDTPLRDPSLTPDMPQKPKGPQSAFSFFSKIRRKQLRESHPEWDNQALVKTLQQEWRVLPEESRKPYVMTAQEDKERFTIEMNDYEDQMRFYQDCRAAQNLKLPANLFTMVNQVIRLKPKFSRDSRKMCLADLSKCGAQEEIVQHCKSRKERFDEDCPYYYVLTFIPDLYWCRLCPMQRVGEFDEEKYRKHFGRPKWKLIPEGEAVEIDVSASRCEIVPSVAVKRTEDADNEEWDITERPAGYLSPSSRLGSPYRHPASPSFSVPTLQSLSPRPSVLPTAPTPTTPFYASVSASASASATASIK